MQLHHRLEALLEEAPIKLSSLISHLLGLSGRRILKALAQGETDPAALAALGEVRLRATKELLSDALGACRELNPVDRRLVKMALEEWSLLDKQIGQLDQKMAHLLRPDQDPVKRLAELPGWGLDSAQPIIAELGATAATFPSDKKLSSWVGARATTRVEESVAVTAPQKATVTCGAFSITQPTQPLNTGGASSSCSAAAM